MKSAKNLMKSVKYDVRENILDNMCYIAVHGNVSGNLFCNIESSLSSKKLFSIYYNAEN